VVLLWGFSIKTTCYLSFTDLLTLFVETLKKIRAKVGDVRRKEERKGKRKLERKV
jgi:hypothetical protein